MKMKLLFIACCIYVLGISSACADVAQLISSAELGDAQSQYDLALKYEHGQGLRRNWGEALRWYTKAAEQGHVGASVDLGWFYQNGEGVTKDVGKAIALYEAAAAQGDAQAQLNLAVLYDGGVDVQEDNALAAVWYQKAADQGHDVAMLNLGINYWRGEGVPQDYEKAWTLLNHVRLTASNKKAQWQARGALDRIKGELGVRTGEFSYPNWKDLNSN